MSDYWFGVTAEGNQDVDGRFGQRGINVEDKPYGASPAATDNSTAINDAIDAAMDSGINAIWLPRRYPITSPVALVSGLTVHGPNRKIAGLTATGAAFQWSGAVSYLDMRGVKVSATGGHVFDVADDGSLSQSVIFGCEFVASGAMSSVYRQHGGGSYIDVLVEACNMTHSRTATVPAWDIENSAGAVNQNSWRRIRANGGNCTDAPFFQINSTATSAYAYDNTFTEITGEQNAGGLVHVYGANKLTLQAVTDYDASVSYADHIIKVDKSDGGGGSLDSRGIYMIGCGRRGGTLGAGIKDIYVDTDSFFTVLIDCSPSSGNAAVTRPSKWCAILSTSTGDGTNHVLAGPTNIEGDFQHKSGKLGLYGATPVSQASVITAPSGGTTQDAEARTAIASIITALKNVGITA